MGVSIRQIARSRGLSHPTVLKYVRRAKDSALSWLWPENRDDAQLGLGADLLIAQPAQELE